MSKIVKREYDDRGNETYCEWSDGFWVKSEYDSRGNETYREFSDDSWWKAEYDNHGNKTYCEDNNGYWEKSEYDENGNCTYYENSHGEKRKTPRAELEQEPEKENIYDDEKGTNGLWDKAGNIATQVGLFLQDNPVSTNETVYAEDYGQEIIYDLLKDLFYEYTLLNSFLDNHCDVYGVKETIKVLAELGASKETLSAMNFEVSDINMVFDELEQELDICDD